MKTDKSLSGKTVLIVHACTPKKRFIFKKIKKLGVNIIMVNTVTASWAKPYVDHWIFADTRNYKEVIFKVSSFKKNNPNINIDGIVTFWEESVLITSKLTDLFNLPGIPYAISSKIRNKYLFRQFCLNNNIPAPRFKIIKNTHDLKNIKDFVSTPFVIKPVFGSASAFVIKIDDYDDVEKIYKYINDNILTHEDAHEWDSLELMVEEYIEGDEVDIDIILQNGKIKFHSMSDNKKTKEPFFVETGQSIPSMLPEEEQKKLIDLAEELLEKLGINNGIIHFEAKSTQKGPIPIELNMRMGGDEVYSFVSEAWHVDLIENALKIAFGEYIHKIEKPKTPYKYLMGEYFLANCSGTLVNININKALSKNKNIHEICFLNEIGDCVLAPPDGYEYMGWITTKGDNIPEAEEIMEDALKKIDFEIAKFSQGSSIGKSWREKLSIFSRNKEPRKNGKIEKIRKISIKEQRFLNVGIACNEYNKEEGAIEKELTDVGRLIEKTLLERGYKVYFLDFNNVENVFRDIKALNIDIVFNVCERINNSSLLEPHVTSVLDILQVPYTGSSPFTLSLCIDKIRVKKLLSYNKIPTPKWDYAHEINDEIRTDLKYPLIIKPANTDNSIGITNDSIVTNEKQLKKQMEKIILEIGRPALIEEYIEGDEYDATILGSEEDDLRVLPLSRSIFNNLPEGYWHIYPFEAKWMQDPVYKNGITVQRPPKNISKKLISLISEISLDTYNILDCHDYGRVEVRVDKNNNPYVLELNPNPSIHINDTVPKVAALVGMDYGDFLEEIIRLAIKRYKDKPPYYHLTSNSF